MSEQKHRTADSYLAITLTVMSIKTLCVHMGKLALGAQMSFGV